MIWKVSVLLRLYEKTLNSGPDEALFLPFLDATTGYDAVNSNRALRVRARPVSARKLCGG